jgi:hypothetical protein
VQCGGRLNDLRGGVVERAQGEEVGEVQGQGGARLSVLHGGVVKREQGEEEEEV